MTQRSEQPLPMRIEMATSEIEGAATAAWADPGQVLACVSWAQPPDTFGRFIEPRLAGIDRSIDEGMSERPESALPARVGTALQRLRQSHVRLYRENRLGRTPSRGARIVLMVVEDDRIYFIKGIPCWVFVLRDGQATPACAGPADAVEGDELGSSEKLRFAVTSLQVQPNDVVVLLASATGQEPDRRAVAGVFEQTQDLKRACDGLVNLFRTEEQGAGAVAVRFVPVGSATASGDLFLMEDLERALRRDLAERTLESAAAEDGSPVDFEMPETDLPAFLREGEPVPGAGAPAGPATLEESALPAMSVAAGVPETCPMSETLREPEGAIPTPDGVETAVTVPAADETPSTPQETSEAAPGAAGRRRLPKALWYASFVVVALVLIAVAGVPLGRRMLGGGGAAGEGGVLRIEPTPPARAILIDGVDQATGSPATLEGVAPGVHRVRMDLGAFGVIEERVHVRAGETIDLRPRATGTLEVATLDARPGAQVWLGGGARSSVPCRLDTLPVGWHEVFYEDDRLPLWERSVLVRAGETTRVRINNAFAADRALLKIESWEYRAGDGLRETAGDSAYVDGRYVGRTPYEAEVAPGLHGVRVHSDRGQTWTEIAELIAGSSRVVAPRFGMGGWPRIRHQEPGTIYLRGPVLLSVRIETPDGEAPRNPRLHLPELNASARDIPLAPVGDAEGGFVGMVDPQWIPVDRPVVYYFTVQTASGETLCSELYRFRATTAISQGLTR